MPGGPRGGIMPCQPTQNHSHKHTHTTHTIRSLLSHVCMPGHQGVIHTRQFSQRSRSNIPVLQNHIELTHTFIIVSMYDGGMQSHMQCDQVGRCGVVRCG